MNKWSVIANQDGQISVLVATSLSPEEALGLAKQLTLTARTITGIPDPINALLNGELAESELAKSLKRAFDIFRGDDKP